MMPTKSISVTDRLRINSVLDKAKHNGMAYQALCRRASPREQLGYDADDIIALLTASSIYRNVVA